jgi:hypothetical protein
MPCSRDRILVMASTYKSLGLCATDSIISYLQTTMRDAKLQIVTRSFYTTIARLTRRPRSELST